MNALRLPIIAASLLLVALPASAQEMKPGLWEITTTMKMQGMQMPGAKFTHCYTAQDISSGKQYKGDEASKCTISNLKTSGGSVSYDMACAADGSKMAGSVKGTVSPTAYTFDQKIRMTPDQGMGEMHSTMNGRRVGDCK
ncbi:MAG: DUF3617 family protein [Rhodocyclaceae bacterium]|nr:DUF3617 family protein [Rhodocyclaceae bacterium]MDZ4213785.1 DUF3617 family protein [Rhodocyclaceae bacterium]